MYESVRKFAEMYDTRDFSKIADVLAEDASWYSSYSHNGCVGREQIRAYYEAKFPTFGPIRFLNYQILRFTTKELELNVRDVDPLKRDDTHIVKAQLPDKGYCVMMKELYPSEDGFKLEPALFHLEVNDADLITKIEILPNAFYKRAEYEVLEQKELHPAWDPGVPDFQEGDLAKPEGLLEYAVDIVSDYVQKDLGMTVAKSYTDPNVYPHILALKDEMLYAIYVEVGEFHNVPILSDLVVEKMKAFTEHFNITPMYASVAFASTDKERFDLGILLNYDKYLVNFKGLEEISIED